MPALRPLLTYTAVLAIVFTAAAAIGYVYEHEPQRDLVEVSINRSAIPEGDGEFASGTILTLEDGNAAIASSLGSFDVALDEVQLEQLRPFEDPTQAAPGAAVNLGGERAATEPVISGVVVIAPEAAP